MKIRQTLYLEEELLKRVKHQSIDEKKSFSTYTKEALQRKLWDGKKLEETRNKD